MNATPEQSHKSISLTLGLAAGAVLLYAFVLLPAQTRLEQLRRTRTDKQDHLDDITRDLRDSGNVENRLKQSEQNLKPYKESLLSPLLGSSAMRLKSLLDQLATAAGLSHATYAELPDRALPLPKPRPEQPYVRRPIRMTCTGSFASAVSFLLRVRRDFPLTTLGGLTVSALRDCERQNFEFIFECPAAGERPVAKTKARSAGGKGFAK